LIGRFWCRYLCPLGAVFGLFNRVSFVKIKLNKEICDICEQCLQVCPSNLMRVDDVGNSTDCIQCGKCVDECPSEAIKIAASIRS
ncbi:MAG: 4Fe-4S dicluster domain-containing protein, partial [Planctomycetes bacterium]|nr:4Fe-4S dicluster domain-containing protein [Planctomycetota bacterium]